jgi:arylsulfatase A-like enzyme
MKTHRSSGWNMTRRQLLKHGVYAGLASGLPTSLLLGGCHEKQDDSRPTNVILISLDTLRADFLGCYGYNRPTSPALDKLASQGVLFEDVSSPSPWTLPAHMSLLTGLYPSGHGVDSIIKKLPAAISTLASVLALHGFATGTVVNYWLLKRDFGFDRGFDHYSRLPHSSACTGVAPGVTSQAVKWLLKHRDERFFLFLHYFDLHADYRALPRYETQFVRPYSGSLKGTVNDLIPFCPQFTERYAKRRTLNQDDINHLTDLYAASIRQMDDELNKFFSFLQQRDLFDQTLTIITSDHGEEFFDHGGLSHGFTQFQEAIHVPLIMSGPGVPRGLRIKEIASPVDIMPTTLGLLGIRAPSHQDGIDLRNFWKKTNTQKPQRHIFAEADCSRFDPHHEMHNIKRAIRHPRYKLHYNRYSKEAQLYDLYNDPQEKIDIADKHTSLFDSMFLELKKFMKNQKEGETFRPPTAKEIEILKSLGYLYSPESALKLP